MRVLLRVREMTRGRSGSIQLALPIADLARRSELVGGVAFLEGSAAAGMDRDALVAWVDHHLVETGRMPRPASIYEPGVGVATLRARLRATDVMFFEIVQAARERTLAALGKLLGPTPDDRFVRAALFASRVRRSAEQSGWVACPRTNDALSDVVLALFAVDVLRFRESYEQRLRICAYCGKVGLDGTTASSRTGCAAHPFA